MNPVRSPLLAIALVGCSDRPAEPAKRMTGHPAAIAGLPRHREVGRFLVEGCCSLSLGPGSRLQPGQGIDSIIYDVIGPGYTLGVIYGPHEASEPGVGYLRRGERMVDGVRLLGYVRAVPPRDPPEATLLWIAEVGGGTRGGVYHTPNVLRIGARCGADATCRAAGKLVGTIRF